MKRRLREAVRQYWIDASTPADGGPINPKKSLHRGLSSGNCSARGRAGSRHHSAKAGGPLRAQELSFPDSRASSGELQLVAGKDHIPMNRLAHDYRAAVGPGIQVAGVAPVASRLPLPPDLLGICDRSGGALRCAARQLHGCLARFALPSLCRERLRPGEGETAPLRGTSNQLESPALKSRVRAVGLMADFPNRQNEPGMEQLAVARAAVPLSLKMVIVVVPAEY